MFRLFRFVFRTAVTIKLMAIAFSAGMGAAYLMQMRALYHTWGLVKGGAERGLTGDELVSQADAIETRSLDIDVSPAQVWPWLAQLGYGRGGWYSYPALDRPWSPGGGQMGKSAEEVLSEFQDLAQGDLVPTHPQGGFEARVVEPGEALVLYLDDSMTREQVEQLMADSVADPESAKAQWDMPPYAVSWAFVLEDAPGGRTRLIERLRFHFDGVSDNQRRGLPLLTMGVFVLMRSQMLGIKRRAEEAAEAGDGARPVAVD
jgi:hypothetical protein